MSLLKLSNNAVSRLSAGISTSDTTLSIAPGDGAKFPVLSAGDYFPATLIRASDAAREIVKVTARATDVFTIVRAQESTLALAFLSSDRIEVRLTAGTFTDEIERVEAIASAALPSAGGAVGALLVTADLTMGAGTKVVFEGTTDDAFEATIDPGNPTADRTLTLPDKTDTLATLGDVTGAHTMTGDLTMGAGTKIVLEGTTDDAFETTLDPGDSTADRTVTLPDASGMLLTADLAKWMSKGIGEIYMADTSLTGVDIPPTDNPLFRYIELTAGLTGSGDYNDGILTSESVSGSAPLIIATAVIDLAGSPMDGQTIDLLNTEERIMRPGTSPGTKLQDAIQGFAIGLGQRNAYSSASPTGLNAFYTAGSDGLFAPRSDGTNGTPRIDSETRVKSLTGTAFQRIL